MYLFLSLASLAGAFYLIYTMIHDSNEEVADPEWAVAGPVPHRILDRANERMLRFGRGIRSRASSLLLNAYDLRERLGQLVNPFKANVGRWQGRQPPEGDALPPFDQR